MSATGEWVIQIHNDRMENDAEYAEAYERDLEEEAAAYYAAEQQEADQREEADEPED
jgi:hypothetical protein